MIAFCGWNLTIKMKSHNTQNVFMQLCASRYHMIHGSSYRTQLAAVPVAKPWQVIGSVNTMTACNLDQVRAMS